MLNQPSLSESASSSFPADRQRTASLKTLAASWFCKPPAAAGWFCRLCTLQLVVLYALPVSCFRARYQCCGHSFKLLQGQGEGLGVCNVCNSARVGRISACKVQSQHSKTVVNTLCCLSLDQVPAAVLLEAHVCSCPQQHDTLLHPRKVLLRVANEAGS